MKVLPNMKQCALLVSFKSSDEVPRVICASMYRTFNEPRMSATSRIIQHPAK